MIEFATISHINWHYNSPWGEMFTYTPLHRNIREPLANAVSVILHLNICLFYHFSVRSIMHKHLMKMGEVTFDKIFNQKLGKCACRLYTLNFYPAIVNIRKYLLPWRPRSCYCTYIYMDRTRLKRGYSKTLKLKVLLCPIICKQFWT